MDNHLINQFINYIRYLEYEMAMTRDLMNELLNQNRYLYESYNALIIALISNGFVVPIVCNDNTVASQELTVEEVEPMVIDMIDEITTGCNDDVTTYTDSTPVTVVTPIASTSSAGNTDGLSVLNSLIANSEVCEVCLAETGRSLTQLNRWVGRKCLDLCRRAIINDKDQSTKAQLPIRFDTIQAFLEECDAVGLGYDEEED